MKFDNPIYEEIFNNIDALSTVELFNLQNTIMYKINNHKKELVTEKMREVKNAFIELNKITECVYFCDRNGDEIALKSFTSMRDLDTDISFLLDI